MCFNLQTASVSRPWKIPPKLYLQYPPSYERDELTNVSEANIASFEMLILFSHCVEQAMLSISDTKLLKQTFDFEQCAGRRMRAKLDMFTTSQKKCSNLTDSWEPLVHATLKGRRSFYNMDQQPPAHGPDPARNPKSLACRHILF